jgi:hypothetical protein
MALRLHLTERFFDNWCGMAKGWEAYMSRQLVQGLLENYRSALNLVADVVSQFKPEQWQSPATGFQVPWKVSYHIVDCLDYYFREKPDEEYAWGHRFGGG